MQNKKIITTIAIFLILIATIVFATITDRQQKIDSCIENTGNVEICNIIYVEADEDYCDTLKDDFLKKACDVVKEKFPDIEQDVEPPTLTLTVNPTELWPPNNKPINVTVSGFIIDDISGVNSYSLIVDNVSKDITLANDGSFITVVPLIAKRAGQEKEGRNYEIELTATDNAGNTAITGAIVIVSHDMKEKK